MRRLLLISLTLGFSLHLSAQCTFQPISKGQYRSSALDVALDGNDLWVATSYGVALFDRSVDPPAPVTSLALPGTTTRIRPTGGPIVYASSGSSIYVLQKTKSSIVSLRSLDVGGLISDLLYQPPYLYVAATNGVTQVDLIQPENPFLGKRLPTSTGKASGLAILGSSLYAADGDSSVEVYTLQVPSFPQNIGTFPSLPRSSSVRSIGGDLVVSDGQQTQIFTGTGTQMTKVASVAAGASSLAAISDDRAFIAGNDRTLRAIDFRNPALLVTLFETSFAPTSGSVNRFGALASAPGHLYAAAGDAGLLTFDTSLFGSPDQVRSYQTSPGRSVFSFGDSLYVSVVAGGIQRFGQDSSGNLTDLGSWDSARVSTIHDGATGRLLTSAGSELRLWDLAPVTPVTLSTATFRGGVQSAVLVGTVAYAILSDQTLWRADLSQPTPASPTQIQLAGSLTGIARSGSAVSVASVNADASSTIYVFRTGDLTSAPVTAPAEGAATSGVTMNGSVAVVSTFKGLTVFEYAGGGGTHVLPGSNLGIARDLFILGNNLFVLGSTSLQIWDLTSATLQQTLSLPDDGVSLHGAGSSIDVATESGVATIQYASPSRLPRLVPAATFNNYFKKVFVSGNQLFLFDGHSVERDLLSGSAAPAFMERLSLVGSVIDVVAIGSTIYVLDGLGKVTGYSFGGRNVGEYQMSEGDDAIALDLHSAAGGLYLSLSRGCSSGNCEKKTLVLDPRSGITLASTLTGLVVDISTNANRAYAIFDTPGELRVLNVTDPFHPVTVAARASEGNPVSVAFSVLRATVYTIGSKVFAYTEASLAPAGQILDTFTLDPSGRLTYLDQQLHIDGDCAVVTGRTFSPALYNVTGAATWVPAGAMPTAAAAKSADLQNGFLYVLTDYSLEVWSKSPLRVRKHPSRR
ncbi:MAG TPA: hypothetical protein VHL58_01715 [Thermoanaerobaculia bacterium]|nr:hypothetical protein [Thermoanaerobaculia bacterium]